MSYTNNWVHGIRQTLTEGHTKQELEKLSNEKLEDLHKEYSAKDDEDSKKEADIIKDILDSRGEEKKEQEKVEESAHKTVTAVKSGLKKVVEKGKKIATRVGETLIDDRQSGHISRDIRS